jgi:hypothetical protein
VKRTDAELRVRATLRELIDSEGRDLSRNPSRLRALLSDHCPEDRRERHLIGLCADQGIPRALVNQSRTLPAAALVASLSARLEHALGVDARAAAWAVGSWAVALGCCEEAALEEPAIQGVSHQQMPMRPPPGTITTVAGTGKAGFSGDGGPAARATLCDPQGLPIGHDGSFHIADSGNNRSEWTDENHKGRLQEAAQLRLGATPSYRVTAIGAPGHRREYRAEAVVAGRVLAEGWGSTKQAAEQAAACLAVEGLTAAEGGRPAPARARRPAPSAEPARVRRRVAEVAADRRAASLPGLPLVTAASPEPPRARGLLDAIRAAAQGLVKRRAEPAPPPGATPPESSPPSPRIPDPPSAAPPAQ